jgi:hypothetical protein
VSKGRIFGTRASVTTYRQRFGIDRTLMTPKGCWAVEDDRLNRLRVRFHSVFSEAGWVMGTLQKYSFRDAHPWSISKAFRLPTCQQLLLLRDLPNGFGYGWRRTNQRGAIAKPIYLLVIRKTRGNSSRPPSTPSSEALTKVVCSDRNIP